MILGHTLGTPHLTVAEALDLFASCGLDGAEVIWQDGYRSGIPEGDRDMLRAVRRHAAEVGLRIGCLTPYMTGLNSLDDLRRESDIARFESCIAAAEELEARRLRVYAGEWIAGVHEPDSWDAQWARLVESLRHLAVSAERRGVVLCVENHFNTMTVSAADSARLAAAVSRPSVGILYDQANLTFTHREASDAAIAIQADWIQHVHVKDVELLDTAGPFRASVVSRVNDDDRPHRSRVIGDGILDWPAILRDLADLGYEGTYSLEYEYRWHPRDLPPPELGFPWGASRLRAMLTAIADDRASAEGRADG